IDLGANHIKKPLMIGNGWGEKSCTNPAISEIELFRTMDDMPYLFPVHQVGAMEDWQTGKILKCRVNQIIIVAHAANTRVRVKSGKNRVSILTFLKWRFSGDIFSRIFE